MGENPKLRPVETQWVRHNGQPAVLLKDRLGLSQQAVIVPQALVPLLPLCDGTRDIRMLRQGYELRTGLPLSTSVVENLVAGLEQAILLEGARFNAAYQLALDAYRGAAFRHMTLAGQVYPAEPSALTEQLESYRQASGLPRTIIKGGLSQLSEVRGLVSPHIDFARGGPIYAEVWSLAVEAARKADLVLVFGTDHQSSNPGLTLTKQSYATPWGVLPTDTRVVDHIASALGCEIAFQHELHHRDEHSIETAAVWLHYTRKGKPCSFVPILCASLGPLTDNPGPTTGSILVTKAIEALHTATKGRRVLAIAAADLAHVGPAFGDPLPFNEPQKASLASEDAGLLDLVCQGDASGFLASIMADGDRRRVCGLPPIYALLQFLEHCHGAITGYTQCPADSSGTSFVSIAGVLIW